MAITKFALRRITDRYPQTVEAAKFSAPYLAAYTLIGAPMLDAFRDEALHDEAVRAAAHKVSVSIYQEYADLFEESPAEVTVTLNDGRQDRAQHGFSNRFAAGADDDGTDQSEVRYLRHAGYR